MAKDFLKEKNISYQEFNVAEDHAKRQEMVEKSGQMGVPVIQVNDSVIVGFNKQKLVELLGITE